MDTAKNLTSEEKSSLSSKIGIWKKKNNNAVFPTTEHQHKMEVWESQDIPHNIQLTEDSLTTTLSDIPLPVSISQEKQVHQACVTKIDEQYEKGKEEEVPWMDRLGIRKRIFSFKWFFGLKRNNITMGKEIRNNFRITNEGNQRPVELNIFPTKQPYIPYELAKAYIIKMTKDMHQMQFKYIQITQKMELIRREEKNDYRSKIKKLKGKFEVYHEQVEKKNRFQQETMKILVEKTDELTQEKSKLFLQANQEKEKWEKEKSWLLKTFAQKMDLLHSCHSVTVQKIKASRLALENIQEILKFPNVQKNECQSSEKAMSWISSAEVEPEFTYAFGKETGKMEDQGNLPLEEKLRRIFELLEKVKQSLQKQESEIAEIIKNGDEYRGMDSPQVPVLVNKVYTI